MGLFGDKKMKELDRQLESGWMALGIGAKTGRGSVTLNNVGNSVLIAASALAADGRGAEAKSAIALAKKSGDGAIEDAWNAILSEVESRL